MTNLNEFELQSTDNIQTFGAQCKIEIDSAGVSLLPDMLGQYHGKVSIGEMTRNTGVHNYSILTARNRGVVHLVLWLPCIGAMTDILIQTHARLISYSSPSGQPN